MIGGHAVADLQRALGQMGLDERLVVGGQGTEQAYGVVQLDERTWRTSWCERGQPDQEQDFRDEHDAVCFLLGSIAFAQLHGGLLGRRGTT